MELVPMTTLPPMPVPEARQSLAARARAAAVAGTDTDVLSPPDPWTEALVSLALAAGRLRSAVAIADDDEWPATMAAHALYLARQRARALECALADSDLPASRVTCWLP